jgi:hypothetical protein
VSWGQIAAAVAGGAVFGAIIVVIARRGKLSMRYTLGWLFIAGCITLSGLLGGLFDRIASTIGIDTPALIVAVAALALLGITVQLSITVSGLTENVRTLAETCAILEEAIARTSEAAARPNEPAESASFGPERNATS